MHFQGVVKKMTTEYSSTINYFIEFKNGRGDFLREQGYITVIK